MKAGSDTPAFLFPPSQNTMPNSFDTLPPQLLNPFTPLAFLPPNEAYQKSITGYVHTGVLSVRGSACIVVPGVLTQILGPYLGHINPPPRGPQAPDSISNQFANHNIFIIQVCQFYPKVILSFKPP
jgi:hypothetical protein